MKFARVSSVKLAKLAIALGDGDETLIMDPNLQHMGLGKIEDPPKPPPPPPPLQVTKPIKVFDRPSI
jgi:hypothetical protein